MTETNPTRASRGLRPFFGGDPLTALRQEMDDLLGRFSLEGSGGWFSGAVAPAMDLSETNEALLVKVDLPGIKPQEIDVEVSHNTLRISGERKEEKEEKGTTQHRRERRTGRFSRSVALPCAVQENKVQAEYHDGVLALLLPKAAEAKTHRIKVAGT